MEDNFQRHVAEWREMNQTGRFAEARQYYFEQLFDEVIEDFAKQTSHIDTLGSNVDVLFSVLGFTPEPIILAARALNPRHHIIFHDGGVKFNEDNMRYLSKFLPKGFEKIELPDESFATIYDMFKHRMALTSGSNYVINVTGGKKSMVAAASIFARDFNSSVVYVDYHEYDSNLRRPIPGTEYLNVVYSPIRDLPELFHLSLNNDSIDNPINGEQNSQSFVDDDISDGQKSQEDTYLNINEDGTNTLVSPSKTRVLVKQKSGNVNIMNLLSNNDWDSMKKYLDNNMHGPNVRKIQSEITEAINSFTSGLNYWNTVNFLIAYNPTVFLGAITKADISKIENICTSVDYATLETIVHNAFLCTGKLRYAVKLLMPCIYLLTDKQKDFIMSSCSELSSPDSFYELFKLVRVDPQLSIKYLLNLSSSAAAFTLYKIFSDGQRNEMLREDSDIQALRPNEVARCCAIMQKSESNAFHMAALLIKNRILSKGRVDRILLNEIEQFGYEGFRNYVNAKEQNIKSKQIASSFTKGDLLKGLRFIKELDNHYLFVENHSQSYALLDKKHTDHIPSSDVLYKATILDMKTHLGKTIFFVTMKKDLSESTDTPLINIGTILEIQFRQNKNGEWCLAKNNYSKILSIELDSIPKELDYRKKQQAEVLQSIDFFTYKVAII